MSPTRASRMDRNGCVRGERHDWRITNAGGGRVFQGCLKCPALENVAVPPPTSDRENPDAAAALRSPVDQSAEGGGLTVAGVHGDSVAGPAPESTGEVNAPTEVPQEWMSKASPEADDGPSEAAPRTSAPRGPEQESAGGGLLPCPFCGSATDSDDTGVGEQGERKFWLVACSACNTAGPDAPSEAEAIVAWNRRAPTLAREVPISSPAPSEGPRVKQPDEGAIERARGYEGYDARRMSVVAAIGKAFSAGHHSQRTGAYPQDWAGTDAEARSLLAALHSYEDLGEPSNRVLRDKLTRVLDWLRFEADSPGGIADEIERTLRSPRSPMGEK